MIGAVLVGAGTPCTAPAAACGCRLGSSVSGTSGALAAASADWAEAGPAAVAPCASAGGAVPAVLAGSLPLPEQNDRSSQNARAATTARTSPRGVFKAGLLFQGSKTVVVREAGV